MVNGVLTGLVAWASLSLPQGYIWSQELSLILLAWVAFLGASMATFQNKHIQISALAGLIPRNLKPYVRPLGLIITSLFCAYITTSLSMSVFGDKGSFMSGEVRPATGIPAWVILFSGVVSFGLITVRSFAYGIWGVLHPSTDRRGGSLSYEGLLMLGAIVGLLLFTALLVDRSVNRFGLCPL